MSSIRAERQPRLKNRRQMRNLVMNPKFQIKYVGLIAAVGLFLSFCNMLVFYTYTKENYSILVDLSPMTDEAKMQLYRELREIFLYLGAFSVGFVCVVSLVALYLSHRAAGPLYHFKRVFDEIRLGKTDSRIHLRPNDDFQDVAAAFNKMMDERMKS